MIPRISLRNSYLLLPILLTALVVSLLGSSSIQAISRNGPDQGDFDWAGDEVSGTNSLTQQMWFLTDDTGVQADVSVVAVYLPASASSWSVTIQDAHICGSPDNGAASTTFILESYEPANGTNFTSRTVGYCGAENITLGVTRAQILAENPNNLLTFASGQSFYRVKIRADMVDGTGAGNGFRVVAPSGGYVSFYSQSGNEFTLQDRRPTSGPFPSNWRFTNYNLYFAPSCDVTSETPVSLNWYDDDWGPPGSFNIQRNLLAANGEHYRMRLIETNRGSGATTRTWGLNSLGGQSGSFLSNGTGFTGNQRSGRFDFTVRPGHRYQWQILHVRKTNGIQFQLPYDSIFWQFPCGDFDYRSRIFSSTSPARGSTVVPGQLITIRGDALNVGDAPGDPYDYRIYRNAGANSYVSQVGLSSGGSWIAADHARWTGGSIGAGSSTANRYAQYRVTNSAPDGARLCFITRVSPRTSTNSGWHYSPAASSGGWCYTVNNPTWNYTINRSGPSDTTTFPKPGNNITISSRVTNTGDGAGANYNHRFRVMSGGGLLANSSTITHSGLGGLSAGSGRTRNATFQVASDATHGGEVCFRAEVAPYRGYTYPSPPSATSSGWRSSSQICYTIYNQRFELENSPNIGFNPSSAGAGEDVDVSYSINNSDSTELNSDYPNAATGPTPNLSVRTQVTTGNASVTAGNANAGTGQIGWGSSFQQTLTITIDNNVSVGDNVCVRVFANWEQGYSDGTGLADNPAVDNTRCFNVSDGPYLQVLGHDTWAGGAYSINGTCPASTAGDILSNARPSLTSSGTGVGAMDQYAAFADGTVSGFGTANDALTDTLTFANDSTLGNFGANRCLANLFDSGGAGGNVDDGLWNNATAIDSSDFNSNSGSFNDNTEGQFKLDSNVSWNNNGRPLGGPGFSGNATILINGNFEIRTDIRLNDSLSVGDVPFLIFVVSGDIRIENDVNRLDGMYISYGQIDTCNTFGISSLTPVTDLTADGPCNQHLEVNGSLIANDIALRRTHGGTNEAATGNDLDRCRGSSTPYYTDNNRRCAAETIIFHPWFWLAEPYFDRGGGPGANQYPIQQLRDLPPIF